MVEPTCLACHGDPKEPSSLPLERNGAPRERNWREGKTVAATIFYSPTDDLRAARASMRWTILGILAAVAAVLLALSYFLFAKLLSRAAELTETNRQLEKEMTDREQAEQRQARLLRQLGGVNRLQEDLLLPGPIGEKFKKITAAAVDLLDLDFCRIWMVKPGDLCEKGCIHVTAEEQCHICPRRDQCLHLMASSGRYTHIDGDHRRVPIGVYKIGRIAGGEDNIFLTNSVTTDPQVHNHEWAKSLGLVSFTGHKLRDANGDPVGVLAMFAKHPISEEDDAFLSSLAETTSRVILDDKAEEELRKTREQAIEANRAKSRFLANMSHEIRTPMTAILGYADLLADPSINPSSRDNYLATIRRSGEHLLALINDILDLSKIEAGKMSLDLGRCNVVALLADVASMVRPRAEQRGVAFSVEYRGEIPETILTDAARLRQAVVNLAGNAVKFTERGSVRIAVSLLRKWRGDQPAVRFKVIDTGIGIRTEVLPQLFQPFSQGEASITARFGGTGLGLAISRHIAHLLGGDLTVTSAWGQGSTFTFTVPAGNLEGAHMLQNPAEVMQKTAGKAWESPVEDLRGVRILLAEDGYDNRELIQTLLRMAGAEVETAENGRLAVDKAQREPFDLILMDMNMPEMDGYEAARWLRDHDYRRPIVALTANAMSGDSELCLAAGCDQYLAKPIDRAPLIRTIAKLVGKDTAVPDSADGTGVQLPSQHVAESIVSQFIDDLDMASIIHGFVDRLAGQLDAMRQALSGGRHEELRRLAHMLKGAGGSYGYPALTEACRALEQAAKTQDSLATSAALDAVAAMIQAIQNGCAAGAQVGGTSP